MATGKSKPWHEAVRLRADILSEELSLKMFATNLYDVMLGRNPGPYHSPDEFFSLTYPTHRLRDLARDVTRRLSGKSEKAVRQLHVTFGGGKTHALIALVHLVRNPESLPDLPAVNEFRTHCALDDGFPRARVAAVVFDHLDAEKGMDAKGPDDSLRTLKMPWSQIAWQLAGEAGLKMLKEDGAERQTAPATNVLEDLLELALREAPSVLILFDEVLWFVRTMVDEDASWAHTMANFLHSLTQAVAKVPRCCLVASLLASETGKMDETGRLIGRTIFDEFHRVADEGIQPVEGHDVPEILRRRLFEIPGHEDRGGWQQQVVAAVNGIELVDDATSRNRTEEEKRYLDSYPFHPDLIDVFYAKWTQLDMFQQTRGILKTLAIALRDAALWDSRPIIGAQVFLAAPNSTGLSAAQRDLADVAQLEQYDGRKQNWPAILESELKHATRAEEELQGLAGREIQQAVIATFLHSQPIGQSARLRDIRLLIGADGPDSIELDKGLSHWADTSWYLDDTFIDDRDDGVPRLWRLGSKPNLKQMHYDARSQVNATSLKTRLDAEIRKLRELTEGTVARNVRVHKLPAAPSDIADDDQFHFAVLGPDAASDVGKPSPMARRYLDETTTPDKPRARNRNAVVLAVPSRVGIETARDRVRDLLAWEKVRDALKAKEDLDRETTDRINNNIRSASNTLASDLVLAWCVAVTVDESNRVAAYQVASGSAPLFSRILANKQLRIHDAAINADALLPGGPYGLWAENDKTRLVKDLVGAFGATARLPKMLSLEAIQDTLVQGCEAGDFVLRLTRSDRSQRTFWRSRPDDVALAEPTLEVVLCEAAVLTEIDHTLLAPEELPKLWNQGELAFADLIDYFSGAKSVLVDKGGFEEPAPVPKACEAAIKTAVSRAVQEGILWMVNGAMSAFKEDAPEGFINNDARLYPPPAPIDPGDILPVNLPNAWSDGQTNAHLIHAALSSKAGKTLPWQPVRDALNTAFGLRIIELLPESAAWPCDVTGWKEVKIRQAEHDAVDVDAAPEIQPAELEAHEIQDLADEIGELKRVTAGHMLHFKVQVQVEGVDKVREEVDAILAKIKPGWRVG